MMRSYFEAARYLKAVLILMDIRHKPTAEDLMMVQFVEYFAIPYVVGATKADKIAKSKRFNECARLRRQIPSSFAYEIVPLSSEDGYGKEKLLGIWSLIYKARKNEDFAISDLHLSHGGEEIHGYIRPALGKPTGSASPRTGAARCSRRMWF